MLSTGVMGSRYTKKPNITPPPTNYTPAPPPPVGPPTPPASDFIEVPAATSCEGQGIKEVPQEDCQAACTDLNFTFTGFKKRPNISGCFVMDGGQFNGDCNFNTKINSKCLNPPCQLDGSTVQQICLRK